MNIVITKIDKMSNKKPKIRLYLDDQFKSGTVFLIEENQGHYLVNVMRVKLGDNVIIFNGIDGEWLAEITKVGKGKAKITIREKITDQKSDPDLWYLFAPVKKARVDYMVQKATELGVSRIIPVLTERTNLDKIKFDKLLANSIEAAEQCGRMTVPQIDDLTELDKILDNWPKDRGLIFCDEAGEAIPMQHVKPSFDKWSILIGPEGGFSPQEREMIRAHQNTIAITLGPRILRADTAAVAALSLWQSFLGDWA
ncbi:MAG TPA: 16S rRNA (uracil(1498)-N(3))-methyltransferase [Emcibacteraceae bacterium]|nr:16S rRNA (uracil(1498)-N(3))-methyltransferase [Emcibacteraceae bacterium]HRW28418.1 16S rRNA (uracil(1498)-N(3))-methyltransferase [Emcibacteraceae bacterium]